MRRGGAGCRNAANLLDIRIMGCWTVGGTRVGFHVDDEYGLRPYSDDAEHDPGTGGRTDPAPPLGQLRAAWTMHRTEDSVELARRANGLAKVRLGEIYGAGHAETAARLFDDLIYKSKSAKRAFTTVSHVADDDGASSIAFAFYVPDRQFIEVCSLLRLIAAGARLRYHFTVGFDGFQPGFAADTPALLSHEEWVAGRPHITAELRMAFPPLARD
jgi:hypothetical protein